MKRMPSVIPGGCKDVRSALEREKDAAVVFSAFSEILYGTIESMCDDIAVGIDTLRNIQSSADYEVGMRYISRAVIDGTAALSEIGELWKGRGYPWRKRYRIRDN